MLNKSLQILLLFFILFIFQACTSNHVSVIDYPHTITNKIKTTQCITQNNTPKVSVVDFTNNTPYNNAKTNYNKETKEVGVYVGVTPIGAGAGAKNNKSKYNEQRSMDARLSQAITSPLEDMIVTMGGVELISRSEMDKIDEELKLQDSGLLDETTLVKVGKLSGVQYLITGSIDNVEEKYQNLKQTAQIINAITINSKNSKVQAGGVLVHLGASLTDGLTLKTKVTVKIIDVSSGKIVFTKHLKNEKFIGELRKASFDQIVGGIKASVIESLPELKSDFSEHFQTNGYITQIKSKTPKQNDLIAQINLGSTHNIKENDTFELYQYDTYLDPITNQEKCNLTQLPITLYITDQINQDTAWATSEGSIELLKLGHIVKKRIK